MRPVSQPQAAEVPSHVPSHTSLQPALPAFSLRPSGQSLDPELHSTKVAIASSMRGAQASSADASQGLPQDCQADPQPAVRAEAADAQQAEEELPQELSQAQSLSQASSLGHSWNTTCSVLRWDLCAACQPQGSAQHSDVATGVCTSQCLCCLQLQGSTLELRSCVCTGLYLRCLRAASLASEFLILTRATCAQVHADHTQ